jgi:hypothetical protein
MLGEVQLDARPIRRAVLALWKTVSLRAINTAD